MLLNRANHIAFCRQVITVSCVLMLSAILPAHAEGNKERGAYLARIMDCGGCHTPGALAGKPNEKEPLSGSEIGFAIPGRRSFLSIEPYARQRHGPR